MQNAGLNKAQAGIKITERNANNVRYADDTTLMAESEEELKSLSKKVKEESGKSWLKTQHSKNKDYGSLFTSGQVTGEIMETMTDFIFLGSKSLNMVTAAMKLKNACSLEEKL